MKFSARYIILTCVLMASMALSTDRAAAQEYSKAGGLRLSTWSGFTFKQKLKEARYGEVLLMFRYRGFEITGLYEVHKAQLAEVDRLNWYFGGGAHVGYYAYGWGRWGGYYGGNVWSVDEKPEHNLALGIDGILGIEYNVEEFPVNFSLDWKPGFNIVGSSWGIWDNGALSVRYMW